MTAPRPNARKPEPLARRIAEVKKRIAPLVADMDPHDVDLIVSSLLRPFGTGRRFFLRRIRPSVYVF